MADWTTACPDWERRIVAGESLVPPPLFPGQAEGALDVLRDLKIVDASGSPTFGESSRPWFLDLAASVFGAYDPDTGRRLIREFLLLISKKNGKSTDAAAIMLTALLRNWRQSAEFYILAPTIEVANNSFYPARDMVRADDELAELLDVREHLRTITHRTTGAFLKVVAADAETVSGKKAVGVLVDELWLFGKRANAENMLAEATGGLVSRPEGFVIWLSTQSDEPPAGVFKEKLAYFRDVRDGKIEDRRSLPCIFEFPPDMVKSQGYLKPENWRITNPNLGLSVDEEWLSDKLRESQQGGPHKLNVFLAKHLNVEIGQSLRADAWPGAREWAKAARGLTLADVIAQCDCVTAGIDGGGLDDLYALGVIGRHRETKQWLAWAHAWCHRSVLELRKSEASKFLDFERDGDLTIIENFGEDIAGTIEYLMKIDAAGVLATIGLDPMGVGEIVDAIEAAGLGGEGRVVGVSQGYKLQGAVKTLERKVSDGTFAHSGSALLAYAVGNAKTELKGNAVIVTKQASGVGKIDPLMALFDAAALMSMNPEPRGLIYSEERRLLVIG